MATETPPASSSRPRPWLLIALAVVGVGFVLTQMFSGGAASPTVPSTPARQQARGTQPPGQLDPAELDVRIEALKKPGPAPADAGRNPFRFQPKPPPPPPPAPVVAPKPTTPVLPPVDAGTPAPPPGPPPPPPIGNTIKFIGIVETNSGKIGAFSVMSEPGRECRATFPGREGEVVEGRYRVVRIGIESAVLEYLNGSGRATLPLNGSACVVK